ncbi:hypothetical protein QWY99_11840 [Flavobacterium branchiarum]|nr:hypothetical protein [Flavobacterium branchiarum]MDN3673746.1 hypothetical protein [Flavobacterium branchiarum]
MENDTDTAIKIKELIKSVKQNPFTESENLNR